MPRPCPAWLRLRGHYAYDYDIAQSSKMHRMTPPERGPEASTTGAPGHEGAAMLSESQARELAELFRALADPTRARIVHALAHQEMTTTRLATLLGLNPPAISQHLRLLRTLRVVRPRREGQQVVYSLDDDHIRLLITMTLSHLQEGQTEGSRLPSAAAG